MNKKLPPPPRVNSASIDTPKKQAKKVWSKPTITPIDDIIYTRSNTDSLADQNEPAVSYAPPSS